MNTNPQRFE